MSDDEIEAALRLELRKIAPDIEIEDIDREGDLREEFDIDSMDFLNLVSALSKSLGVAMPEEDYSEMGSYDAMLVYLRAHTG
ncbi:acyl carrier protein [Oricola nitratireducens]|jgi:acyl carrier protein|uniref:acyl carrier protein n=1 Tax=Oricola nitratireducens TaxID=2775868 RepID=UPI001865BF0C|nr:phosphopantetheine-binding protein [Oricola nitratireducens]